MAGSTVTLVDNMSDADRMALLPPEEAEAALSMLDADEQLALMYEWSFWRRPQQVEPDRALHPDLVTWLLMGGRGSGKTRPGAETVRKQVESGRWGRVALVGATAADVRDVMIEGESGILAVSHPHFRPVYQPSKRRLTWPNGAQGFAYSAEEPDRLRGPQHHGAWADEIAAWRRGPAAWDQLMFGLRLGLEPWVVATTTPKPLLWLRELVADVSTITARMSTYENRANLAPAFLRAVLARYKGTRLGAQEIDGILLDDVEGALWQSALIERGRRTEPAEHSKRVVGVDPAGSVHTDVGIVVAGLHAAPKDRMRPECDVIIDLSMKGQPEEWAKEVVAAYYVYGCDAVAVERNYGGDMCRAVIHAVDPRVRVEEVHATRGKAVRAEPIATMYDTERVHHLGYLTDLESEQTSWVPEEKGQPSPNRIDALVWAITWLAPPMALMEGGIQTPVAQPGRQAGWRPGSGGMSNRPRLRT